MLSRCFQAVELGNKLLALVDLTGRSDEWLSRHKFEKSPPSTDAWNGPVDGEPLTAETERRSCLGAPTFEKRSSHRSSAFSAFCHLRPSTMARTSWLDPKRPPYQGFWVKSPGLKFPRRNPRWQSSPCTGFCAGTEDRYHSSRFFNSLFGVENVRKSDMKIE